MSLYTVFNLLLTGCSWVEVERSLDNDTGRWKSSAVETPGGGIRTSCCRFVAGVAITCGISNDINQLHVYELLFLSGAHPHILR
jgi:hypothetical protein